MMEFKEPPDYYGEALIAAIRSKQSRPEICAALIAQMQEALADILATAKIKLIDL